MKDDEAMLTMSRRVEPCFPHGLRVANQPGFDVGLTPSGLLITLRSDLGEYLLISRFAWDGIVAAVADILADSKEQARQNVIVDNLLNPEDDD